LKKTLKKLSKIIVIAILLLALDLSLVFNCVQAFDSSKKNVYEIDYCDKVLKYKGIPRGAVYVVYDENGKQYPAYCINPEKIGVGDTEAYDVSVKGYISDVTLWRIITNGYPYKSLEQLGVKTEKEAYLATKQAIYCYLDNRNVNEYSGIGESGERTLKALKQIWNNAMNSDEVKISNVVDILPIDSEWKQDKINDKYISKTYKVETPAPITDFTVEIQGENIPEELMVVNINNKEQKTFKQGENFKILIPTNILNNNGSFEIKVTTKMEIKPVLFGVSPNEELQNYALTTFSYEDTEGSYSEKYQKNEAEIKILKQEKDTKIPLKGVEFQILNSDKNVILQSLITDENGEILLKGIEPGRYYIKEIKTLQGYILYNENIQIDISLNEKVNVVVNNSKEKNIEVTQEETNIEVSKKEESILVKNNYTNIEQEINRTNINHEKNETNIKKLPKTGM